jgi:type I restriction enzyme S subunit
MKTFELRGSEDLISELAVSDGGMEVLPAGSVLMVTRSGILSHTFPVAIAREETAINQDIKAIKPIDGLDERFLAYTLKSLESTVLGSCTKEGTTVASVETKLLERLLLPLAPLNEQHRIAAKLDTTLAAVEACRQRLDRVAAILKRFRHAVLAAATSGKLTQEWREERGMEKDWLGTCLSDIANIQGGLTKDSKKQDPGDPELPYLRVANVQRGYLDLREMAFIRVPRKRLDALLLQDGDILFIEGGDRDKVGRGWIWEAQITECVFQNHVFRARLLNEGNQPKYVSWWANTCGVSHFLEQGKQTTNLASISKTTLGLLPIQLPCAAEQVEIVRRVETFFTLADQLEARLTAARKVVDRLTPALLAKAFRGELVPQDPNDVPASVLLERIRAYRQVDTASGKPTRPRRRNAQTSITKPSALTYMHTRNNVQANHLSAILKECGPLSPEALWSASQLEIDDFYAQLKDEEAQGFLLENRGDSPNSTRLLEPAA